MIAIAVYGVWRPRVVFDNVHEQTGPKLHPISRPQAARQALADLSGADDLFHVELCARLATPLQYYLQNTLHSNDAQWGEWNAIFTIAFIPTYYAVRLSVPQDIRCARFCSGARLSACRSSFRCSSCIRRTGALIAAAPIGLMGGVATAAYTDLLIRSCPPGFAGLRC